MIIYAKLEEGDIMLEGDEISYGFGKWHLIPAIWIGEKLTYKEDNTMGRRRHPVRRGFKIGDFVMKGDLQCP